MLRLWLKLCHRTCCTSAAHLSRSRNRGDNILTYFVKYKWSVLSKLKLSRILLINTHTSIFGCQLPFGYGNLTTSLCFNDCSAELLYCRCEAQQALEHPTGAGCHHTCLQHGAGGRQPRGEVTEQLRSILTTVGWDSSNTGRRDHSHPQVHTGQSLNSPENWKVGNRELYKLRKWFHHMASFFTRSVTVRILKSQDLHLCTILNLWQMCNFNNRRARNRKVPKIF